MDGWGKVVAGALIGIAGTVYATNEEFRKQLPKTARDLPVTVRRRFDSAVSAAKEASRSRRAEILRDLERHAATRPTIARFPEGAAGAGVAPGPEAQPGASPDGAPPGPHEPRGGPGAG